MPTMFSANKESNIVSNSSHSFQTRKIDFPPNNATQPNNRVKNSLSNAGASMMNSNRLSHQSDKGLIDNVTNSAR